ncbi:dihydrolipoyl dehydrogenase [Salegentibacter mishustinae]|uniref:Dihydrolipoyl dehydrogenase n=1 Tax=Salegentibacter mishustinae TaxID=270918 RepID=A0A0Q9ZAF5_9FLAO|nr:dihydrolipoyl dehydrogenase [Salegentibacter mishustinae]KRG30013.1 dihydrolipoamide dehydrogenase [Salegentibacter mishustinae]PNW20582.1 dihydrolipoamide dehydrogenase [Salegentibacter mishustinae]PZX61589.1 dihydrolipoamide dehydrogenase [Salegentibacter mishustinae]GGW98949.1 dihydrolipoyl dehydrogenase [Salegentibacter mishustinae]
MAKKDKKELVIIGAGPGGYAAAFHAADLGIKVTLIDPEVNPGGVCLYRGCIPSKALLHLAKTKEEAMQASKWGMKFEEPKIDIKKVASWKEKVVKKLTEGLGQLSKARNIEYIQGKAKFTGKNELEVTDNKGKTSGLSFEKVIIATGSSAVGLPELEIDHEKIWDATDALELKELPKKMLVVGGGYIGLELGSVYAALGTKVSIAEMTPGFLPGADRDLVKVFEKSEAFKNVFFETKVEKVKITKKGVKVSLKGKKEEQSKKFDCVLVAVGRKPNTQNLGLKALGISANKKGFLEVDDKRRTKLEHIFAIGDITGEPMLAHKASHEGRIAAEVIAGKKGAAYDPKVIPAIVFTNPELVWCGLTEEEVKEKNKNVKVVKFPWSASGRAVAIGENTGLTKLLIDKETEVILGGAVAGKNAGSLIPEIALAIEMGSTASDLSLTIHPHPTLSETIMESAELFYGGATHYKKS